MWIAFRTILVNTFESVAASKVVNYVFGLFGKSK
jgi:hypothetical protein